VASAIVVALIGVLAYFGAFPDAGLFKLYDRAKSTFQDPNVFGPFLVLPATVLTREILTRRLRDSPWQIPALLVILAAIFLSFSRAAWGMAVVAILITAYLAFVTENRQLARFRLVAYVIGGGAFLAVMLAGAISVPAVRALWVQRAELVESYDGGKGGRFDRQQEGFFAIQEKPLGFGPFQFGLTYGEDEHNMWLKGFTVYGWLGGFAYIILVGWTLAASTPLLFKPRPWTPFIQSTYAAYLGHLMIHNVIDNDHWRHLFLIYGVLWGAIAAEKLLRRRSVRVTARPAPAVRQAIALPTGLAPAE
jgi:O-antigen ligase